MNFSFLKHNFQISNNLKDWKLEMRRNETSMHVNSESSYKQVPGHTIRGSGTAVQAFKKLKSILDGLLIGKRFRFNIQKWFKKVMVKKKDLFARHHVSNLLEMHGQINRKHSSFIPMEVVVVDVKDRSYQIESIIVSENIWRTKIIEVKLEPDSHVVLAKHIFIPGDNT